MNHCYKAGVLEIRKGDKYSFSYSEVGLKSVSLLRLCTVNNDYKRRYIRD